MYRSIGAKKPTSLNTNVKFALVVFFLLSTSVITPLVVNLIQTKKRIDDTNHYNIPAIKPPVEYSAPNAFKLDNNNNLRRLNNNDPHQFLLETELKQRFFTLEGPSSVYGLLQSLDGRTREINARGLETERKCLGMEPIKINIGGWPKEDPIEIWIQCYDIFGDNEFFMMFGKKGNVVYLYERGPTTTMVGIINMGSNDDDDSGAGYPCCYKVNSTGPECVCNEDLVCVNANETEMWGNCRTIPDAWKAPNETSNSSILVDPTVDFDEISLHFSVGNGYTSSQTGSRGIVQLQVKPKINYLQATAAGIGLGFCGVQFASYDNKILVRGSMDGPGGTCLPMNETCATENLEETLDLTECTNSFGFSIFPHGRQATSDFRGQFTFDNWEASEYPGGEVNDVDISNTPNSNVNFGPGVIPQVLIAAGRNFNDNN